MGYCISQRAALFNIPAANKAPALERVKRMPEDTSRASGSCLMGGSVISKHFAFVNAEHLAAAQTLEEAFAAWRWEADGDKAGNIDNINFSGDRSGDDELMFGAIAEFVESGSYIEMQGEDGAIWRWCFDDGKFSEKGATITWE